MNLYNVQHKKRPAGKPENRYAYRKSSTEALFPGLNRYDRQTVENLERE